jgi:hypothetical protein
MAKLPTNPPPPTYIAASEGQLAKNPGVPTKDLGSELVPLWREYDLESEG